MCVKTYLCRYTKKDIHTCLDIRLGICIMTIKWLQKSPVYGCKRALYLSKRVLCIRVTHTRRVYSMCRLYKRIHRAFLCAVKYVCTVCIVVQYVCKLCADIVWCKMCVDISVLEVGVCTFIGCEWVCVDIV